MSFNKYPYTDFHEMNDDWVIAKVKELIAAWAETKVDWEQVQSDWADEQQAFQDLKDYVNTYFADLDVQTEINNKLDAMALDGTLGDLISPYVNAYAADHVPTEVASWLSEHVDPDTGYVIDDTLSITDAAADAKATGDAIEVVNKKAAYNTGAVGALGYSIIADHYITSSGALAANNGRHCTDFIYCPEGATIKYAGETNRSDINAISFYNANKTYISGAANVGALNNEYSITAPSGTRYMRLSWKDGIKYYADMQGAISGMIKNLVGYGSAAAHIFIAGTTPYCCNFNNNIVTFYGTNKFVFDFGVVEIANGTAFNYSAISENLIYIAYNRSSGAYVTNYPAYGDVTLVAFQKNYLDRNFSTTLNAPYAISGTIENVRTISLAADMTSRLLITDCDKKILVEGNNHVIDLGEYLVGSQVGDITTIPYTAAAGSYYYKVFISHELSMDPIRAGVYYAVLVAIKNGVYTRLTPYADYSDVETHDNSFTYDGTNIYVNCADYDNLVAIQNSVSCIDVRKGVKVRIQNLTIKHSAAQNFTAVEGSEVELYHVTSVCSGMFDGFRFDYGTAIVDNCEATYNGRDGFNFNNGNKSIVTNCIGSHNLDDGISHHEAGTNFDIVQSIFEDNAKGGISSPVLGAVGSVRDCISKNNYYGLYTYSSPYAFYSGCVTEGNTSRILASNPTYMTNCISSGDGSDSGDNTPTEYNQ